MTASTDSKGQPAPALQSLDRSFKRDPSSDHSSKTLFPSLRQGYVASPLVVGGRLPILPLIENLISGIRISTRRRFATSSWMGIRHVICDGCAICTPVRLCSLDRRRQATSKAGCLNFPTSGPGSYTIGYLENGDDFTVSGDVGGGPGALKRSAVDPYTSRRPDPKAWSSALPPSMRLAIEQGPLRLAKALS